MITKTSLPISVNSLVIRNLTELLDKKETSLVEMDGILSAVLGIKI